MNQSIFGRLKQKVTKSNRSNSSLMLPIQYYDSPIPSHSSRYPDESLSSYYNNRATEVQNLTPCHQTGIMKSEDVTNDRVSKTEEESIEGDRYGGILHHYKRVGFRSTILSVLPTLISKKRTSDDRIHLVIEKDLEPHAGTQKTERHYDIETPPPAHLPARKRTSTLPHASTSLAKPISDCYLPKNAFRQCFPFFSYFFAFGSIVLLIYNTIVFKNSYGTIISLSPFNLMLGPNMETFVQSGALFIPCMRSTQVQYQCAPKNGQPTSLTPPAWKYTLNAATQQSRACALQDLCGLVPTSPNTAGQFYRFMTAIAVHSGFVQWTVNMAVLLSIGADIERTVHSFRFTLSWIISGSFGYMFSALFLNENTALMGCFGSMNGIFGLALVHLRHTKRSDPSTKTLLIKLILFIGLGIVLGYMPGYSNFSHLGGLMAGILSGIVMVPTTMTFVTEKKGWILMMLGRVVAFITLGISFYLVLSKFYSNQRLINDCAWCNYLSCLPIFNMCS